ncbi:MAG: carboxypeptidase-like regulatory domain-containing protein, partial [Pyrinomonadaceae bacterium]
MKKIFFLLIFCGFFDSANATSKRILVNKCDLEKFVYDNPATIKGIVSAKTNNPNSDAAAVQGAVLTLTTVGNSSIVFSTISDENGNFLFDNIPAGTYNLKIEAAGLPTANRELKVESGAALSINIDLTLEISEQV